MQNFDDMGEIAYIQSKKNGAQISDIANLVDGLVNGGVDMDARGAIIALENQKGEPGGLATLDISGRLPLAQLPEGIGGGIDDVMTEENQAWEV